MSLPALLSGATVGEGTLSATIGPDWLQGRTAYGGATAAIALATVKHFFTDLPPLRSAQIAFVGPLANKVASAPTLLRRGRNSAFIACDVSSDEGLGLRALFLFMTTRTSAIEWRAPIMPQVAGPLASPAPPDIQASGFLSNFDRALEQEGPAGYCRWARLRDRDGLDPEVEMLAVADALPPAAMALAQQWGPISTTTWQLNIVADQVVAADGWWLLQADTLHAGNGSSSQSMTIWNRSGTAIATATQSVALFI